MLIIERMKQQDLDEVSNLEQKTFSMPWSKQGFMDTLSMENVIFLVAREENELAGYCGVYLAADEGEITNVAVDEKFRKHGIGQKIVSQLLLEAKEAGASRFVLEVRYSNAPAIRLYEKLDFKILGIRKGFYERPKEDAYIMSLEQAQ